LLRDDVFQEQGFWRAGMLPDEPDDADRAALSARLVRVLTNPVLVFRDASDRTSYFGFVEGEWVQVDFDRDGRLVHAHVLDDYETAVWLCEAGHAGACATRQAMDDAAWRDLEMAGALLSIVVGLSPAGIVVDVADIITACPEDPASFNCGFAVLGIIPGVPSLGRWDDLLDIARRVLPPHVARHLPTDVPVRDPHRFKAHGDEPGTEVFRGAEARTATRFEEIPELNPHGVRLERDPSGDVDWLGSDGLKYDAFGSSGEEGRFSPPSYRSIVNHATKADVIIVDWNEIPARYHGDMEAAIAQLLEVAARYGRNPTIVRVELR
jgi:hypothetical protein